MDEDEVEFDYGAALNPGGDPLGYDRVGNEHADQEWTRFHVLIGMDNGAIATPRMIDKTFGDMLKLRLAQFGSDLLSHTQNLLPDHAEKLIVGITPTIRRLNNEEKPVAKVRAEICAEVDRITAGFST